MSIRIKYKKVGKVKYRFAKDSSGSIIQIEDIPSITNKHNYFCICCNNIVIPKVGNIRAKHFAHKSNCLYSEETYLHKTGKLLFEANYLKAVKNKTSLLLQYYVIINCTECQEFTKKNCRVTHNIREYNLSDRFKSIDVEKGHNGLVPDLRIYYERESIMIEIAVSHKCTEKKIKSGNKIIEFIIKSEKDLEMLYSNTIKINDPRINFYNFNQKEITTDTCPREKCPIWGYLFAAINENHIIQKSGRIDYLVSELLSNDNIHWYKFYIPEKDEDPHEGAVWYQLSQEYEEYLQR